MHKINIGKSQIKLGQAYVSFSYKINRQELKNFQELYTSDRKLSYCNGDVRN